MAGADPSPRRALAVIVPAFEAAATVGAVVSGIQRALPGSTTYVVDDGSSDGTAASARRAGAIVLVHERNRGKGTALASGICRALADHASVLATLDADGQHPPELLPLLVAPLERREADLVLGARARAGAMPWARRATNWLSATVASRVAGVRIPDAQTGFRAFTRALAEVVQPLTTPYHGYDYEACFLLVALRSGARVISVDVPTIYGGAQSHFRHWGDGWRVARVFARYLRGGGAA